MQAWMPCSYWSMYHQKEIGPPCQTDDLIGNSRHHRHQQNAQPHPGQRILHPDKKEKNAVGIFVVLPYYLASFLGRFVPNQSLLAVLEGVVRILIFILYFLQ